MSDEHGAAGGMRTDRRNRSTWRKPRKPTPVTLQSPQIPHDLILDRTRAAAVGSQRFLNLLNIIISITGPISEYLSDLCFLSALICENININSA
jgi:hypothetical protein